MKLFFFITKSEAGGAQTHVAQLTKFFVARGDEVAIMSAPDGWLEQEALRLGAHFFPNPHLSNSLNPWRFLQAAKTLTNAVHDFQPDLIACHSTVAGLLGRFVIRNRIPTVFTAHGWGFQPGAPRPRRVLLPILERLAARFCVKIICVSQNDLALARAHHIAPPEKLTQIYNGVEMPDLLSLRSLDPPSTHSTSSGQAGSGSLGMTRIIFIGRLAPPKNPYLLIRAVAALPQTLRDRVRVIVIGDGPEMTALQDFVRESQLGNQVDLPGALPREEVLRRLQTQADLFVLLSSWEGFPYSIIEAMACGVPVIASDVGGVREAITSQTGILLTHNDIQTLSQALEQLIQNPKQRKAMGEQAHLAAQKKFSVDQMYEATLAVYQSLV
ncbi:glycosyltransferase family 4 protein [Candidatus Uhrbacteria bacterium]|nr:glycosyltransferase family 4 protein [Candidatus Uhrbacteria bacterium]